MHDGAGVVAQPRPRLRTYSISSHPSGHTVAVAFGQQSGPPASARQVQELLTLLQAAGHSDFRDGRGPMGFTQRQAGGRFTHDEAAAFIDQLQAAGVDSGASVTPTPPMMSPAEERALRRMPAEHLAAELQRRGWIVIDP